MKFSAGLYFAFPTPTFASAFVVFNGVGILSTTLLAFNFGSKLARRWIVYSTRDFVGSVTCVCSRKGRLMFDVERYRMSSNSPSGGMKLIDLSESNLPRRTHWWNWQSSSSTALSDFGALPSLGNVRVTATAASWPTRFRDRTNHSPLLQDQLVVQAELALWRSAQVRPHQDLTIDICSEHGAYRHQQRIRILCVVPSPGKQ
jgi:hypothetical protein